jgi:transcriptional regulator with XRE-family HTH domain
MNTNDSEKIRKNLGKKLKLAREKSGLTQLQVANASGVGVNYYAQIERGEVNPSFEKLQSIMKALNIKKLDIF